MAVALFLAMKMTANECGEVLSLKGRKVASSFLHFCNISPIRFSIFRMIIVSGSASIDLHREKQT